MNTSWSLVLWLSNLCAIVLSMPTSAADEVGDNSILGYYDSLIRQVSILFPDTDTESYLTFSKRKFNRHGRDVPIANSLQLEGLAKRLDLELERRKDIESSKLRSLPSHSSVDSISDMNFQLKTLQERLQSADKSVHDEKSVRNGRDEPPKNLDLISNKIREITTSAGFPAPQAEKDSDLIRKIRVEVKLLEGKLDTLLNKEPGTTVMDNTTPIMEFQSKLDALSQELSKLSKSSDDVQKHKDTTDTLQDIVSGLPGHNSDELPNATQLDKWTSLGQLLKNIVQVNKLAYLDLSNKLEEVKNSIG